MDARGLPDHQRHRRHDGAGGAPYGLIAAAPPSPCAAAGSPGSGRGRGRRRRCPTLPARDLGGRLVTPALIDCHTHLVFGGDRAREFEMRLEGASYEEVARAGGGIVVDGARDPRGGRGRAARRRAAPGRRADRRGRRRRSRSSPATASTARPSSACCGSRARSAAVRPVRVRTSFLGAHAVPGGPRRRRLHRRGLHPDAARGARRGAGRRGRRLLRGHRLQPGAGRAGVRRGAATLGPAGEAPRRAALEPRRRARWRRAFGALSADHLEYLDADGVRGDGRGRHRRGDPARRLLHPARDPGAADRAAARRTACRWRWPPTATPAPRRWPRCCSR